MPSGIPPAPNSIHAPSQEGGFPINGGTPTLCSQVRRRQKQQGKLAFLPLAPGRSQSEGRGAGAEG